jgi:calreticulin
MLETIALLAFLAIVNAEIFYKDYMETDPFSTKRWVHSDWKQDTGEAGKFEWSSGLWSGDSNHKGIRTPVDAKFYSATSKMSKTFDNTDQTLVLQFSVKHEQKIDCGGGYVKLLPPNTDQSKFNGESPYTIMFGPDICGMTKRIHVIFNHNGQNLLKKSDISCPDDEFTHFYTLIVRSDDTWEVLVDGESKEKGQLKEGWDFEKPKMIKDPNAKKPSDWVDREHMDDPSDVKPADWDAEPEKIADPEAVKPDDWNEEEDGKWEAPTIPNPKYKGQWKPKQIKNPDYKGPWIHPEISNPDYVEHSNVYKRGSIGMVGIEIWQVKAGTLFGDFLLTNDENEAKSEYESRKIDKTKEEAAKKTYDDAHKPPEPETPPEMPEEHEEL